METLTLEEIISAVDGTCLNHDIISDINITLVSIDSRTIGPGALYIPIKGDRFDGHSFILEVFEKGCLASLTEQKLTPKDNQILIYVKDTKAALMNLSAYYRSKFNIPTVAITGSVGKTTTKDLISSVLSTKYKVHSTKGNLNNEIGLPLTILDLNKEDEVLVVEMGMNHFGEIHNLSMIAKPDIGVITNIGVSHIEHLGSKEGILKAKCEILDGMTKEAILIVNGEDNLLGKITADQQIITYGRDIKHKFYAKNIEFMGNKGISAVFYMPESCFEIMVPAVGEHMIDNALAAIAVGKALHLTDKEIQEGLKGYKPSKMRMDLQMKDNSICVINDAYNASPDSMIAAIKVLSSVSAGKRRVAILGDMFELGEYSKMLHGDVGEYAAKEQEIDLLITVGKLAGFIQEKAILNGMPEDKVYHFQTQEDLIKGLDNVLLPGDVVLVKASRGMALEKTVDEIGKVNFNE